MHSPFADYASHAYIEAGLDRADPIRHDSAALAALWQRARVLLLDAQLRAVTDADAQPRLAHTGLPDALPDHALFLGIDRHDELPWFALVDVAAAGQPLLELRQAASQWPAALAARFAYARAMLLWQQRTRFCTACGGALALEKAGFVGRCRQCAAEHYPRVDPAVIVAVEHDGQLLLGRQAGWAPGRLSLIAGFVEPGETLEQAVVREVHEETRIRVDIDSCRYLGAQPWPFPGALMLGFAASAHAGTPQVDGELEHAAWYDRDAVGLALADAHASISLPPPLSIARSLIAHWYARGLA
jgi:NAD+ diphosphatase